MGRPSRRRHEGAGGKHTARWRIANETMATEHYAPTGAAKWIVIGTILAAAFAFSLNAKGTILEDDLIIQAMDLDRYTSQWVTGPEGVVGLVSLFAALHLSKTFGFRRLFIAGNAFLAVG